MFSGHEHFYERIKPQKGIAYFIIGNSAKLRKGDILKTDLTAKGWVQGYAFILMEIVGDDLYFQTVSDKGETIDAGHLANQRRWSDATFGPGTRLRGVIEHIRKELVEVEESDGDLSEWVDVIILAFDGALRSGAQPQQVIDAVKAKQAVNEARSWPDWRNFGEDQAIEDVGGFGQATLAGLAQAGQFLVPDLRVERRVDRAPVL